MAGVWEFIYILSFITYNIPMRQVFLLHWFYKQGDWGTERDIKLPTEEEGKHLQDEDREMIRILWFFCYPKNLWVLYRTLPTLHPIDCSWKIHMSLNWRLKITSHGRDVWFGYTVLKRKKKNLLTTFKIGRWFIELLIFGFPCKTGRNLQLCFGAARGHWSWGVAGASGRFSSSPECPPLSPSPQHGGEELQNIPYRSMPRGLFGLF